MLNLFPKESERANHSYLVTTKLESILEIRSLFQTIMIGDLCSLNTFRFGVGTEMKGGYKN